MSIASFLQPRRKAVSLFAKLHTPLHLIHPLVIPRPPMHPLQRTYPQFYLNPATPLQGRNLGQSKRQSITLNSMNGTAKSQVISSVTLCYAYAHPVSLPGTYLVDPQLELSPFPMPQEVLRKREKVWGKSFFPLDVNAAFRTQQRAISIDLSIVAPPLVAHEPLRRRTPAHIYISSEQGRIQADLVSTTPHICRLRHRAHNITA